MRKLRHWLRGGRLNFRQGAGRRPVGRVRFPFYIPPVSRILASGALALSFLLMAAVVPAAAGCSDRSAPGVDWRRCLLDERDFQKADLTGAVLRDASFGRAKMAGARLANAEGPDARFTSADLSGADLTGAVLRGADFTRAMMGGAILAQADLRQARFFRADLRGATLTGAELSGADLSGAQLGGALWVDGQRRCAAESVGTCQ